MPFFKTEDCDIHEVNFFTSGNYSASSYTRTWETRHIPDNDFDGTPIYLQVLNKFNIPTTGILPSCGTLPGIDIKNMDALQAIKFSLAECLTNGQWWDIYEDGQGGVYFQLVFDNGSPGVTVNLDIRSCIPTATKTNEIDMVIVHGYKPPPERFVRDFNVVVPLGTGVFNPESISGNEDLFTVSEKDKFEELCHGQFMGRVVYKSYKDPVIVSEFGPQEPNPFYNPKAFESIIGYVHKITGMDPSPRVKYNFQNKTLLYREIELPLFHRVSRPSCAVGVGEGPDIWYYEANIPIHVPYYDDRYGFPWPLLERPTRIVLHTYTIEQIIAAAGGTSGAAGTTNVYVNSTPNLRSLDAGANWIWQIDSATQFTINMYYQPQLTGNLTLDDWDFIQSAIATADNIYYADVFTAFSSIKAYIPVGRSGGRVISGSDGGLGELVVKAWIGFEVDRPCVEVIDAEYDALSYAQRFKMEWAPIIIYNPEKPTAYFHKDAGGVIVDYSEDLVDADPTTCQNFENTSSQIMQDRMTGQSLELNLPFCENADVCLEVARTIFQYMNNAEAETYSLSVSPTDNPTLGAHVNGFDSTLRIDSISYSYNDSSNYTITVNLGPVFANISSFQAEPWIKKTQDISREGIVVWTAGDSVNYRVYVQGLGVYTAVNATPNVYRSGEKVTVQIYNSPVEA
jgi:hypothetical protein